MNYHRAKLIISLPILLIIPAVCHAAELFSSQQHKEAFLNALGKQGLREVAEHCYHKAHYLAGRIAELDGYELRYDGPYFCEFVIKCPKPAAEILAACKARGILGGVDLSSPRISAIGAADELLIAVTEKRTRAEMDGLVEVLQEVAS